MEVVSAISDCQDDDHGPRAKQWIGEVVHRIRVPGHQDAAEIARFDRQLPTLGGKMAYTLVIRPSGLIEQALAFDRIGWHARGSSRTHIGIGCIGDFRDEQLAALMDVLTWCSHFRGGVVNVFGHTEKQDATSYSGHDCPGVNVDMDAIRAAVAERVKDLPPLCDEPPPFVLAG